MQKTKIFGGIFTTLIVALILSIPLFSQGDSDSEKNDLVKFLSVHIKDMQKQMESLEDEVAILKKEKEQIKQTIQNQATQMDKFKKEAIPLGTIVAWHKSLLNTPSLPKGWVECDGQTLNDTESIYHDQVIPDLNGEGRFLRGSKDSGIVQAMDWKSFYVAGFKNGTYTHADVLIPKNGYNTTYPFGGYWASPGNLLRFKFDDSEVRPINMSVVWIIKVK